MTYRFACVDPMSANNSRALSASTSPGSRLSGLPSGLSLRTLAAKDRSEGTPAPVGDSLNTEAARVASCSLPEPANAVIVEPAAPAAQKGNTQQKRPPALPA